jgi:transposase
MTGELTLKSFEYDPGSIAAWISGFEKPKAVYESGVTGFDLARSLKGLGIDIVVGAVSKMQRPPSDKRRKNDRVDAEFLARLLSMRNITEVMIPDEECEAARDISRALEDLDDDLARAKQRLTKFLMRHGYIFNGKNKDGKPISYWTNTHWRWIEDIEFSQKADQETLDLYKSEVKHLRSKRNDIEQLIRVHANEDRWKGRIDALRCIKGIETITAFCLVVEAQVFTRFKKAEEFAAWTGLVPSEHSSGQSERKGGITKTGNAHCRRLLIEASWHFVNVSPKPKKPALGQVVPKKIANHADDANRRLAKRRTYLHQRGKKPVVANCATARELACWVWSIGRMCEGTL